MRKSILAWLIVAVVAAIAAGTFLSVAMGGSRLAGAGAAASIALAFCALYELWRVSDDRGRMR